MIRHALRYYREEILNLKETRVGRSMPSPYCDTVPLNHFFNLTAQYQVLPGLLEMFFYRSKPELKLRLDFQFFKCTNDFT